MNAGTKSTRKALLVDKKSQGMIIWRCTAHWFLFVAAASFIAFIVQVCMNPFAGLKVNAGDAFRSFAPTLITLAAFLPVFVYDYLKLSHRIFGPVFRIRAMLKQLETEEQIEPLKVRENDSHAELVEDLNALVKMVNDYKAESVKSEEPELATTVS